MKIKKPPGPKISMDNPQLEAERNRQQLLCYKIKCRACSGLAIWEHWQKNDEGKMELEVFYRCEPAGYQLVGKVDCE